MSDSSEDGSGSEDATEQPPSEGYIGSGVSPADIAFETLLTDVCCHPTRDTVAIATVDGDVFVHSYSMDSASRELLHLTHHRTSCRKLRFTADGSILITASKDKSLCMVDLNSSAVPQRIPDAHSAAIYSLCIMDQNLLASGDDDGHVKVWDRRRNNCIMDCRESEDFISDLAVGDNRRVLLATCGDGTLTAFNLRQRAMELQSEPCEDDFLSLALLKHGRRVVVGAGDGSVNVFNWGRWGNLADRLVMGRSQAIDSLAAVTEDHFCMGTADGHVRVGSIGPNKCLGLLGTHGRFPVESLSTSRDKQLLASCSHDQRVKFWDISYVDCLRPRNHDFFATLEESWTDQFDFQ
uniref:WD repeat-containing protein 55 homolog n=1 Tax=Amblyomma triste TaxID=251400 RepID=A0A023GM15_AMBTT